MKAFALTLVFTLIHLSTCGIIEPAANAIINPGIFIVTLQDDYNVPTFLNSAVLSGTPVRNTVTNTYEFINSFAVRLSNVQLGSLNALPEVKSIEYDQKVSINYVSQQSAPWGLARISQRDRVIATNSTYKYQLPAGYGIRAYVIDTGIEITHPEFGGRAEFGTSFISTTIEPNTDKNGHGTHVAGTIGSNTYGVSKNVTLVAVKVLAGDGSGAISNVISGIGWVVNDYNQRKVPSVINLSLGGSFSQATNDAVKAAVAAGITTVVAAGNDGQLVKLYSPASEASAITVAASDINDAFASFSNYGPEVDIIAPGVGILSTWINGGTNTISGTSMATPHVAGLAANFIYNYGLTTPAAVIAKILQYASQNKITTTLPNVGLISLPDLALQIPQFLTVNELIYNNVIA